MNYLKRCIQRMLEFNSETHTYTFNGRVVPSVTQVLKSAGLIDTTFYKNDAAERGTYIHAVLEAIDKNPMKTVEYTPEVNGYVEAWEKFKAQTSLKFKAIEDKVFSKKFYCAGTIDRICELEGRLTIIDIKTGIPQQWHSIQTAGYELLTDSFRRIHRSCVYLNNNGSYKLDYHGWDSDEDTFLHALAICQWKIKEGVKL